MLLAFFKNLKKRGCNGKRLNILKYFRNYVLQIVLCLA